MMTTNNNTTTTTLSLQQNFHDDGYIILPSLLSPSFISQLHTECLDIFTSVLNWLTLMGAADFQESCRPCRRRLHRAPIPDERGRGSVQKESVRRGAVRNSTRAG